MKNYIFLILILNINLSFFGQSKKKYNLTFIDLCTSEIVKPEFEIDSFPDLNYKLINISINRNEEWNSYYTTNLKTLNDTIYIPRLLFSGGTELHSKRWVYLKCNKISDKNEVDFYKNGKKRIAGEFIKGKPLEIKEYKESGELYAQIFYILGKISPVRINYFNKNQELYEYETYKYKKRKTIIKRYNRNNKLINKEVEKH